jgi:hypothetical protein
MKHITYLATAIIFLTIVSCANKATDNVMVYNMTDVIAICLLLACVLFFAILFLIQYIENRWKHYRQYLANKKQK